MIAGGAPFDSILIVSKNADNAAHHDLAAELAAHVKRASLEGNQRNTYAWACYRLGNAFFGKDNYVSAASNYEQAIETADLLHDSLLLGNTLSSYGVSLLFEEKYQDAEALITKAIYIAEVRGDSSMLRMCNEHMAVSKYQQGDFEASLLFQHKALSISRELSSELHIAFALQNIGLIHERKDEFSLAEKNTLQALEIRERLDHFGYASECCKTLSFIYLDSGEIALAKQYYQRYKELRSHPDHPGDEFVFEYIDVYQTKLDSVRLSERATLQQHQTSEVNNLRWKLWITILLLIISIAAFVFFTLRVKRQKHSELPDLQEEHEDTDQIEQPEVLASLESVREALKPLHEDEKCYVLLELYRLRYEGLAPKEITSRTNLGSSTVYKHLKLIRKLLKIDDIRSHAIDIGIPLLTETERNELFSGEIE